MRILVDECVDWRIVRDLPGHYVRTVKQLGWEHTKDGALLALAANQFDVFLTVDKDLPGEQHIPSLNIAVVVLRGRTTRLVDLRALLEPLHEALAHARPGELTVLSWRDLS